MSGAFDKAIGHAKEAIGDATDNDDLKREGQIDRAKGLAKEKVGDAKDWIEDKIDEAGDHVD